jgi:hypothetical protein
MDKQESGNRFLEVFRKVKIAKQQVREDKAEQEAIRRKDAHEEAVREGFDRD